MTGTGNSNGTHWSILNHRVWGTPANALIVRLPQPSRLLSSRDGLKTAAMICNCYLPKSLWPTFSEQPDSWDDYLAQVLKEANGTPEDTAALSTGVTMTLLATAEETYEETQVTALVTAGVSTNALRIGKDPGNFVEKQGTFTTVGTINTIVLTNHRLETAALAASFITITEAKNIALQEMNVKSVYTPEWQATGTGTDQIVTVSGEGEERRYVGGHTKLGELMARAVTAATIEAIRKGREADGASPAGA